MAEYRGASIFSALGQWWRKQVIERRTRSLTESPVIQQVSYEGLLGAVVLQLSTAFTSMFATRMGATASQIGTLSALPQLAGMLVLIPGALISGRMKNSRSPVAIFALLTGLFYGLAGLAPWMGIVKVGYFTLFMSLANAAIAIYNATWQNYFSDLVPVHRRNDAYTGRTQMTFIAAIVVVLASGLILGQAQTDSARLILYQSFYLLAFVFSLLQFFLIMRSPKVFGERAGSTISDLGVAIKEMWQTKSFRAFAGMAVLFHMGWYMAWPLFFLVEVRYLGANETWLSYITVTGTLAQFLTVPYWSRFISRHGNRLALVVGVLGLVASPLTAVFSTYLPFSLGIYGLLFFNILVSLSFSAFQLSMLQCTLEVIPGNNRNISLALFNGLLLLGNALFQKLGVTLYSLLGEDHRAISICMLLSFLLRLLGTLFFYARWKRMRHLPDSGVSGDGIGRPIDFRQKWFEIITLPQSILHRIHMRRRVREAERLERDHRADR